MSGYIGTTPSPQTTQARHSYTATASQTTFNTSGYTAGFVDVYLNGVKLIDGTDFTATNGSDVVLTTGAALNDLIEITTFGTFEVADSTFNNTTLKSNVTLKNDTEEDSDGGRASKIIYQGEQSGGEITTLAEIQASHDGSSDDEKGDLIFRTNDGSDGTSPTEAMRIESDQQVLITTSADAKGLTIKNSGNNRPYLNMDANRSGAGNNLAQMNFKWNGTDVARIIAVAGADTTNKDDAHITFGTASAGSVTERLRIRSEGGITFNGDTAAANALDDYEEGIAQLTITTGSGTIGLANGGNGAYYTKIGRLVTIGARLDVASTSSPSGQLYITGLPFVGLFDHDSAGQNAVTVIIFSPSTNLEYNLCGEITNTHTTSILLRDKMGFTGGVAAVADHIDSGSLIAFTATYVAAS